jgi:hypothetical protein
MGNQHDRERPHPNHHLAASAGGGGGGATLRPLPFGMTPLGGSSYSLGEPRRAGPRGIGERDLESERRRRLTRGGLSSYLTGKSKLWVRLPFGRQCLTS